MREMREKCLRERCCEQKKHDSNVKNGEKNMCDRAMMSEQKIETERGEVVAGGRERFMM